MMDGLPDKEFLINLALDDFVERFQSEFKLSNKRVAFWLRDKASELAPRKQVKTIKIPSKMIAEILKKSNLKKRVSQSEK